MQGFSTQVYNARTQEYEYDFFENLADAVVAKKRYFNVSLYYAHTEKRGLNTVIILDSLVRKQDGTPL